MEANVKRLLRSLLVAFSIAACACGSNPSAPTTGTGSSYEGWWLGEYSLTACQGERHCTLLIGTAYTYRLRLEQNGTSVRGILSTSTFLLDVTGNVGRDGELLLTGSAPAASSLDGVGDVELRSFVARQDRASGLLGSLEYEMHPSYNPETSRIWHQGAIVSGRKSAPGDRTSFDGSWSGVYVVRSCTPTGWIACWPDRGEEVLPLDLQLSQTGNNLRGELRLRSSRIPVTGIVSASGLTLEGTATEPVSGGSHVVRLTNWLTQKDTFGRLTGRFGYVHESRFNSGEVNLTSYSAELSRVVSVP